MKKEKKIVVFTLLVSMVAIMLVVYRYEKLLLDNKYEERTAVKVTGGVKIKSEYTVQEIQKLIKAHPYYLNDSITIYENGTMVSSLGPFNGTLQAVMNSESNMNIVRNEMKLNNLPLQYNIYVLASNYYRQQYPEAFIKKDTLHSERSGK